MKTPFFLPLYIMVLSHNWLYGETDDQTRRATRTVILDETGVRNLRIETEQAKERVFESTVFAIGRIEEIPANRSVLSTRTSTRPSLPYACTRGVSYHFPPLINSTLVTLPFLTVTFPNLKVSDPVPITSAVVVGE